MIWLKNSSRLLIKREPYILTRPGLLADTAYVRTISRIDLDNLALVDEQRNANFRTSLYGCRFQGVSSSVTFNTRFCISNF